MQGIHQKRLALRWADRNVAYQGSDTREANKIILNNRYAGMNRPLRLDDGVADEGQKVLSRRIIATYRG